MLNGMLPNEYRYGSDDSMSIVNIRSRTWQNDIVSLELYQYIS